MSRMRTGSPKIKAPQTKFYKLEYYRSKYGLTQREMADLLGVNLSTYNQKVNRRQKFNVDEMLIIHAFLNAKAHENGEEVITLQEIFLP